MGARDLIQEVALDHLAGFVDPVDVAIDQSEVLLIALHEGFLQDLKMTSVPDVILIKQRDIARTACRNAMISG
jgi:hypothetical protein